MDAQRLMIFTQPNVNDLRSSKGYACFRRGIFPGRKHATEWF
jgi:hypothetical protein